MPVTPDQIINARALLGLTIHELSQRAGITSKTLLRVEAGRSSQALTRVVLRRTLEAAGATFLGNGSVTTR